IGLDAAARKNFYNTLLEQYETRPRTIIFSTHLIDEVSLLFVEVLILREGDLIMHEKAEVMRQGAFSLSGSKAEVEQFIQDKQVMKIKELANMMTAFVFCSQEGRDDSDFNVESVPIKELKI